jgi:hypothetical protein
LDIIAGSTGEVVVVKKRRMNLEGVLLRKVDVGIDWREDVWEREGPRKEKEEGLM